MTTCFLTGVQTDIAERRVSSPPILERIDVEEKIVLSPSALVLNGLLYQKTLMPRWLSGWELVGAILSLATYSLQFFDIHQSEFLYLPIGVRK